MTIIDVQQVSKRYGATRVLDGVSFSVGQGTITALLGANGAGKTTLIDILTTATRADSGTARVAGHDVRTQPREVRRSIAVTGQSATVDGMLTGRENIELIGRLQGLSRRRARARADALVASSGLVDAAARQVRTYSGGMRRRLDLALSLIRPAPVVFLDEPTTGLDARARNALWEQVRATARSGATVLLTTQYLEEADHLADTVLILHGGVIAAHGTPAELKRRIGAAELTVIAPGGSVVASEPTDATADGVRTALAVIEARVAVPPGSRVDIHQPTLDDAFLALTTEVTR